MKKLNSNLKYLLIIMIIISIFEIFLSGMLTAAKYSHSIASICGDDLSNSCNTVQNSPFSNIVNIENENNQTTFQIPITLLGIFFYIILTWFLVKYYKLVSKKQKIYRKLKHILLYLGIGGFIFSVSYTLIQAFVIEAYCKFCLFSALNTCILFFMILYIYFFEK